jgi:hypothetical protein
MVKASDSEASFIEAKDSSEDSDSFVFVSDDDPLKVSTKKILPKPKKNLPKNPTKTLYEQKELFQKCKIFVKQEASLNELFKEICFLGGTEKYLNKQQENALSLKHSIFCMFSQPEETEGREIALELYKAIECFVQEQEGAIEKYEGGAQNFFSIFIKNKRYTPDDLGALRKHFNLLEGIQTLYGIVNFTVDQNVMDEPFIKEQLTLKNSEPKKTK